jgi:hypothetical protein
MVNVNKNKYNYSSPPYGPNASSSQTKEIKDLNSSQLAHLFNLKVTSVFITKYLSTTT